MDKKLLRVQIREQLKLLDKITYEHFSYKIAESLFKTNEWKKANMIGVTISIFPEIDTWQIIRKAWEDGKKLVVPRCIHSDRVMDFRQITSFSELEQSSFGLYEPNINKTIQVKKEQIDLLIVPGLAFDRNGYRIGFGGGYYDRFLVDYSGQTISLAFSQQIIDSVPIDDFDIPVQKIITEVMTIECQKRP